MLQDTIVCRFCLESKVTKKNPLIEPCDCKGSIQFVHEKCLLRWRRIDPYRNAEKCLICLVPYRLLKPAIMEDMPDDFKLSLLFLRFPMLLCFTVNYGYLLQISFLQIKDFSGLFVLYQYLFQILYMVFFWKEWKVRNRELYWLQWNGVSTTALILALFFGNAFLSQGQYVAILPLNLAWGLVWHRHRLILQTMNRM